MRLLLSLLLLWSTTLLSAQTQELDPDFARKIQPKYKLDLSANTSAPTQQKQEASKTKEELEAELEYFQQQKMQVEQEIKTMEANQVDEQDPQYLKMQFSRKWLNNQINIREKDLAAMAGKSKK